jgi:predicted secreted protein
MLRSKTILIVCHCLLNANAKVYPLARCGGVYLDVLRDSIENGTGLFQLPCPENGYLGLNRWGMTREQYEHRHFREYCRNILSPSIDQIAAFVKSGYQITGVIGMDGSPNCGINRTCTGFCGGEISFQGNVEKQRERLKMESGRGVFMEIFSAMLAEAGIFPQFQGIDEEMEPTDSI